MPLRSSRSTSRVGVLLRSERNGHVPTHAFTSKSIDGHSLRPLQPARVKRPLALGGKEALGVGPKDELAFALCELCVEHFADAARHRSVRAEEHPISAQLPGGKLDLA